MKIFLIILFILNFSSISQAFVGRCFDRHTSLENIKKDVTPFLLEGEKISFNHTEHCVEFDLKGEDRIALIDGILSTKYRTKSAYRSQNVATKLSPTVSENCRMEIQRTEKERTEVVEVKVGGKTKLVQRNVQGSGKSTTQMLLGMGRPGLIKMNGDEYYLKCDKSGAFAYEVTLSLERDYGRDSLSTSIRVQKDEQIDLGSMSDEINKSDKKIGIPVGINHAREKSNITYNYYLYIR